MARRHEDWLAQPTCELDAARDNAHLLVVSAEPAGWVNVYAHSDGLVQPLVVSVDHLEWGLRRGQPLWCEGLEDGIVLHETRETDERLSGLVGEARSEYGLERAKREWAWSQG